MNPAGKRALVTGGSSGIGLALALALARAGAFCDAGRISVGAATVASGGGAFGASLGSPGGGIGERAAGLRGSERSGASL